MTARKTWSEKRREILAQSNADIAYHAAQIRFELGRAVRTRREELGLTQAELADRSGLRQPAVARFEAGGTMPTIPLLERLATALEMRLSVQMERLVRHPRGRN